MTTPSFRLLPRFLPALLVSLCFGWLSAHAQETKRSFDIPAGKAEATLKQFSDQAGTQFFFSADKVNGTRTNAVKGEMTAGEALDAMLSQTQLVAVQDKKTGAYTVQKAATVAEAEKNGSSRPESDRTADGGKVEGGVVKLETFEVMGTKLLNMDLPRSRDDAQPYVIFAREKIEQSGATDLGDFLKTRLTMNTVGETANQSASSRGNSSAVNLRGLGTNQTLILVDGHRVAASLWAIGPEQSDINGIPLAAVERIEVLPTTASGIYGGSATGGVVNIILRRDYAGSELKLTYENTFESDSPIRRVDFNAGLNLEKGKTNILIAGSYSDNAGLLLGDRDFVRRGRELIMANNPAVFLNASNPPLGATTNIRSVNGSPLFGPGTSNITHVPAGYAGGQGLAPLLANAGKYNLDLADSAASGLGAKAGLTNATTTKSITATIRRQFAPRVQSFLELGLSKTIGPFSFGSNSASYTIAASAPNNPFGQAIRVTFPDKSFDQDYTIETGSGRMVGGVIVKLGGDWLAEIDYTWNRATWFMDETIFASGGEAAGIMNGTLDPLRDTTLYPLDLRSFSVTRAGNSGFDSTLQDAVLRMSGPVWHLPGGTPAVSLLLERRDEELGEGYQPSTTSTSYYPARFQEVTSAYVETRLPIVGADQKFVGIHELEIQLAGRRDDYATTGATGSIVVGSGTPIVQVKNKIDSVDYTVGLRYKPVPSLMLRASYGTGFLPPAVGQLVPNAVSPQSPSTTIRDPKRGNELLGSVSSWSLQSGGNPDLRPEESRSLSAGMVLTPRILGGLRLSLDYSRIEKRDNITTLAAADILAYEDLLPGQVVRGAIPAGDPYSVGPVTLLHTWLVNIARAEVEAYDAAVDYTIKSAGFGEFELYAGATWQTHYITQVLPTSVPTEMVGVNTGPLKFKANGGLTWRFGRFTAGWATRHFHSYLITNATAVLNMGTNKVPSQRYHDIFLAYRFGPDRRGGAAWRRWTAATELQIGVKNVFNTSPPVSLGSSGTGLMYSVYGDPRLASYLISVKRGF